MRRRTLLAGAAAGLAGLAGCLSRPRADLPGSRGTTTDRPPTTEPTPTPTVTTVSPPERPSPLTESNVVEYVKGVEHAHVYNELWEPDVRSISISCDALFDHRAADGYVLFAACGGGADYGNAVGDLGAAPSAYFVDAERTVRIHEVDARDREDGTPYAGPEGENVRAPEGLRLYNFDDTPRSFDVHATHEESGDVAYEHAVDVPAESGVLLQDLVRRVGTYALDVTAASATASLQWEVSAETANGYTTTVATLSPGHQLSVGRVDLVKLFSLGPV